MKAKRCVKMKCNYDENEWDKCLHSFFGKGIIMNKSDFSKYKGKKLIFEKVSSFPDVKVKWTESFPDFNVKISDSSSFADSKVIKYQEVNSGQDVLLKKTASFPDFEIYFK